MMKRGLIFVLGAFVLLIVIWKFAAPDKSSPPASAGKTPAQLGKDILKPKATGRMPPPHQLDADAADTAQEPEEKKLAAEQVEAYLQKVKRNAESLLNAFEETHDKNFLKEAAERFPNDPRVQLAMLNSELSPEDHKAWLEKFKSSSPQNALGNYLAAIDAFKSGQTDSALTELQSAAQKGALDCFSRERLQSREEMYLLSGLSPAEAKERAMFGLTLSLESAMKQLSGNLADLEKKSLGAGDATSAQQLAGMGVSMARRWADEQANPFLISGMVGMAMEKKCLMQLDPNTPLDFLGETPAQRLQKMQAQKEETAELTRVLSQTVPYFSDSEKLAYFNRVQVYGERSAMRWLQQTYGTNSP